MRRTHLLCAVTATGLLAGTVSAERRSISATTRLHRCGDETCLLIAGRRSDAAAPILIAGHDVAVGGGRSWRTMVPLRMVQEWSAPAARSITVEVAGQSGGSVRASLPIGVLGHVTELAFLDVGTRH